MGTARAKSIRRAEHIPWHARTTNSVIVCLSALLAFVASAWLIEHRITTDGIAKDMRGVDHDANVEAGEAEEMLASSKVQRVYEETKCIMCTYSVIFFLHAAVCEAPVAIIECLVRAAVLGATAIACIALGIVALRLRFIGAAREALLSLVAMLTLLVPCAACLPYRGFDSEEEWELRPLPTVLGWIDVRRLCVFSYGQGNTAGNVVFDRSRGSQDTCGKDMLCVPRELFGTDARSKRTRSTRNRRATTEAQDVEMTLRV